MFYYGHFKKCWIINRRITLGISQIKKFFLLLCFGPLVIWCCQDGCWLLCYFVLQKTYTPSKIRIFKNFFWAMCSTNIIVCEFGICTPPPYRREEIFCRVSNAAQRKARVSKSKQTDGGYLHTAKIRISGQDCKVCSDLCYYFLETRVKCRQKP